MEFYGTMGRHLMKDRSWYRWKRKDSSGTSTVPGSNGRKSVIATWITKSPEVISPRDETFLNFPLLIAYSGGFFAYI